MNHLHDALHAMPWWVLFILILTLAVATQSDCHEIRKKNGGTNHIDNIGSWLCLAALVVGALAWWWT
jgi:hypothetical protein